MSDKFRQVAESILLGAAFLSFLFCLVLAVWVASWQWLVTAPLAMCALILAAYMVGGPDRGKR